MNKTKIIMVRHGQSEANANDLFAGHSDFDLTFLGKQQASFAADYLYGREKLDAIYSSDLLRAHNTALPFSEKFGLPINDTESLREMFAGLWEGLPLTEIARLYTADLLRWRDDFSNARCTGGESVEELYLRIVDAVCKIASNNIGKTLLITTHATPIRAVECFSHGWGAERMSDVPFVRNSSISFFEFDADSRKLTATKTDFVDHLDPSLVTTVPTTLKN